MLDYTGGTLVMPMTVLVEEYWLEISAGLHAHGIPVRHFVLHAEPATLTDRIENDAILGPSDFRRAYLEPYAEAVSTWLQDAAELVDTSRTSPAMVAQQIAQLLGAS